jgi:galactokinase
LGDDRIDRRPPSRLIDGFHHHFARPPTLLVRAPGRVDLIGAHTDYNDGFVLPMAIDRDAWLAVAPADGGSSGGVTTVVALDLRETATFDADLPLPPWARYPSGVAQALASAGLAARPMDAALTSDVPAGAGVSSSAALEVAFATAWQALGGWEVEPMELARLCRQAENDYVGVACGIMDQFACVFGQAGCVLLLDCRSLDWHAVPLPPGVSIVVADTTTRRHLAHGALNARRAECRSALSALRELLPHITALRDVTPEDLDTHAHRLPEPERSRARHVVAECARVRAAAEALAAGDAVRVGRLMDESHISARDLYAASGPAIEAMWHAAHAHPACLGGRFIGAGFAGCLVFLVRADSEVDFIAATLDRFRGDSGLAARLYPVQAAQGAQVVPVPPASRTGSVTSRTWGTGSPPSPIEGRS